MLTDAPQGSVRAEGPDGTAAGAEETARYTVAQATADTRAAGRRAWGSLLCHFLRGALAARERSEDR
jgi:hypothetical protein